MASKRSRNTPPAPPRVPPPEVPDFEAKRAKMAGKGSTVRISKDELVITDNKTGEVTRSPILPRVARTDVYLDRAVLSFEGDSDVPDEAKEALRQARREFQTSHKPAPAYARCAFILGQYSAFKETARLLMRNADEFVDPNERESRTAALTERIMDAAPWNDAAGDRVVWPGRRSKAVAGDTIKSVDEALRDQPVAEFRHWFAFADDPETFAAIQLVKRVALGTWTPDDAPKVGIYSSPAFPYTGLHVANERLETDLMEFMIEVISNNEDSVYFEKLIERGYLDVPNDRVSFRGAGLVLDGLVGFFDPNGRQFVSKRAASTAEKVALRHLLLAFSDELLKAFDRIEKDKSSSGQVMPDLARAEEKNLAGDPRNVREDPYSNNMDREAEFLKVLERVAPHVDAKRRGELARRFAAYTDPVKPMRWADKPECEDFETFFRREYRDRGLIEAGITAADVGRYDKQFETIYRAMLKRGRVAADCELAKAGPMARVSDLRRRAQKILGVPSR